MILSSFKLMIIQALPYELLIFLLHLEIQTHSFLSDILFHELLEDEDFYFDTSNLFLEGVEALYAVLPKYFEIDHRKVRQTHNLGTMPFSGSDNNY